jgi:hypothetical protein
VACGHPDNELSGPPEMEVVIDRCYRKTG